MTLEPVAAGNLPPSPYADYLLTMVKTGATRSSRLTPVQEFIMQLLASPAFVSALEAAAAGTVAEATWAELAANPGTRDGQRGEVHSVAGTHVDPVTAGSPTVQNIGLYSWSASPAGWRWLSPLTTVADDSITNAKLANMASAVLLGRVSAGSGDAEYLTAAQVRTLLELVVGTNVQAYDADLKAIADLVMAADQMVYATGPGTWNKTGITAVARMLLAASTSLSQRQALDLGNVDNTADIAKPISTATADALAFKAPAIHSHAPATGSAAGFMLSTDKTKLDSIAVGATANANDAALRARGSHTGTQPIASVENLSAELAARATTTQVNNLNTALGEKAAANHGHTAATGSAAGFMPATDKAKLDSIAAGATANATDAALRARGSHTGTQPIASVENLSAELAARATKVQADELAAGLGDTRAGVVALFDFYPDIVGGARERPGDALTWFTSGLTGDPRIRPTIGKGVVETGRLGRALRIRGQDADPTLGYIDVVPKRIYSIEAGRTYLARFGCDRVEDPSDPEQNAVECRLQSMRGNFTGIVDEPLGAFAPTVAGGPVSAAYLIGKAGAPGTLAYTIDGAALYVSPHLRVYGNGHQLDVALISLTDVTDRVSGGADIATLFTALEAERQAREEAIEAEERARDDGDALVAAQAEAALAEARSVLEEADQLIRDDLGDEVAAREATDERTKALKPGYPTTEKHLLAITDKLKKLMALFGADGLLRAKFNIEIAGDNALEVEHRPLRTILKLGDRKGRVPIGKTILDPSSKTVSKDLLAITDKARKLIVLFRRDRSIWGDFRNRQGLAFATTADVGAPVALTQRVDRGLRPYGTQRKALYGEDRLRQTRMRLRGIDFGEVGAYAQCIFNVQADSWGGNKFYWLQTLAEQTVAAYGDAGIGWLGFSFSSSGAIKGGARLDSTASVSLVTAQDSAQEWVSSYTGAASPDIGSITATKVGSLVTIATTVGASALKLFAEGGTGDVRYRWSGGAWTTLTLSGTGTQVLTLAGLPAGPINLQIEARTIGARLMGACLEGNATGVRWNKLAASGSNVANWVSSPEAPWATGWAATNPHCTIVGPHGTNDQSSYDRATYYGHLKANVARIRRATPSTDILIVSAPENVRANARPMSDNQEAALQVAYEEQLTHLDLQDVFGPVPPDYGHTSALPLLDSTLIHPSGLGGRLINDAILSAISPGFARRAYYP